MQKNLENLIFVKIYKDKRKIKGKLVVKIEKQRLN